MKTLRLVGFTIGGMIGCLLVVGLVIHQFVGKAEDEARVQGHDLKQGPFAGVVQPDTKPFQPPSEIHLDLQNLSVANDEDHSDEKQVLERIEKEMGASNFPVMEVRWVRVAPGRVPEARDLIYGREAFQLEYRRGVLPLLKCRGVKAMDLRGMGHAVAVDIARDMGVIGGRK